MFKVVSPSYKRSNKVLSHNLFNDDKFYYAIHEFEKNDYKDFNTIVMPDSLQGNIARCRNFILNKFEGQNVIQVDDDIKNINIIVNDYEQKKRVVKNLTKSDIESLIYNGFEMANDCEATLWGINCQNDPMFYHIIRPFSFQNVVLGTFSAITKRNKFRYDENLPLKEDYDFFIQNILKNKKVLRFNMFHYDADHQKMSGGCQDYRTKDKELLNAKMLKEKYGKLVKFYDGDINPIIKF